MDSKKGDIHQLNFEIIKVEEIQQEATEEVAKVDLSDNKKEEVVE